MKNVNNMVRGLLVVMLAFVSVVFSAGVAFAANESMSLPLVDARVIVTNGATNYVSDFNSTDVLTLDISASTISQTTLVGDAAYRLSFADGNLFVAAGKYDSASTYGGLQVLGTSAIYGKADTYTYSKVFAVSGGSAFAAFLDDSYIPFLEKVSYDGSSTITPISDVALDSVSVNDITALTVSGGYAYVGIQDGSNAGYVNVVDTSTMLSVGTYVTSDAITSVTAGGGYFYAGHGNTIDVVNTSDLTGPTDTIDVGALVNDLTTDGNYLYVATENGLQVYALDLSFVGEYNTSMSATAVSVDGTYIYLATSDGTDSEIFKIEMVVITLTGDNPQTVELGAGYTELGATVSDDSEPVIDTSDFVDAIGSYTIVYAAVDADGNSGLQVTRTVNVVDTQGPVITLVEPNPQTIQQGSGYTELGATTDDGSLVQIDDSAFVDAIGSYSVTYDSVDASGNNAVQVVRTVNVVALTHTITASAGADGSITPDGAVVTADGADRSFTITPDTNYHVLDVLVDDVSVGAVTNYTFTNVVADHTIVASFEVNPDTFTITASANPNGTITPSGAVIVNSGDDQTFTIAPDSGYRIANVIVDDVSVGEVTSYTFTDVMADHTIAANFASSGSSGSSGGSASVRKEIPGCGMRTTGYSTVTGQSCVTNIPHEEGQVLGAEKFIFTLFLKQGQPPYPTGTYANEVMELQKFLNGTPYNSGLVVDGKFGPLTKSAVVRFQLANGLVGDGLVGLLTRAVLNR